MKASKKLRAFFYFATALAWSLMIMGKDSDAAAPFVIIASTALFSSWIAELIERQD